MNRSDSGSFTKVAEYSYDSWGNVLSATGELAETNPFRYRGYYYDAETGFYYLQSRYYDPAIGRFISADGFASTGQDFLGFNMFAYCNNTPIGTLDSLGCWPIPVNDQDGSNFCKFAAIYKEASGEDYIMPVYSYLGNTTFEVTIEYDQSYENTAGILANYGKAISVAGLVVSIVGGVASSGIVTGVGILVSGGGVVSAFQDDDIPTMDGGVTKYTITSHYYYQDPMTNEMVCVTGHNIYYYNSSTKSLFDGNLKKQICKPREGKMNEKM